LYSPRVTHLGAVIETRPRTLESNYFQGTATGDSSPLAHEEGNLNDIRAILGNDVAIKAYRENQFPFPDGTIIARLAWKYVPSEENNKVFVRAQSFVAGPAPVWYLQYMVKDSKKYAATGSWGFAQFDKDGKPVDDDALKSCFPCHEQLKGQDFVFTHYAP
jgi:hypothetical protein